VSDGGLAAHRVLTFNKAVRGCGPPFLQLRVHFGERVPNVGAPRRHSPVDQVTGEGGETTVQPSSGCVLRSAFRHEDSGFLSVAPSAAPLQPEGEENTADGDDGSEGAAHPQGEVGW
jgi:hypothetical protein